MKDRLELCSRFEENRFTNLGVELGCYNGDFSKRILEKWQGDLFLVDIWKPVEEEDYIDFSNQHNYKNIIVDCVENIKGHEDRCFMLRMDGCKAHRFFPDESLDFVYIDANHKYEAVVEDIKNWFPKVRKGGLVCGHDYLMMDWYQDNEFAPNGKDKFIWGNSPNDQSKYNLFLGQFGVNPAVDEFAAQNNYKVELTQNDWFGSWLIQK